MRSNLFVNEDEDGNGTPVFVEPHTRIRLDTLAPVEVVRIITAQGISEMTTKQFETLVSIARSTINEEKEK